MADLDGKYVKEHMTSIHTPDSWARSISERALSEAVKKIGAGTASSVTIDAKFHVTPVSSKSCIQVCGEIGGVMVCTHINV